MTHHSGPSQELRAFQGMVTGSPRMHALFTTIRRAARSEAPVLVRGETGSGKELVARALHDLSGRRDGPFQTLNCALLTGEMLASELFGHVKGAFTGATRDRVGMFQLADGGTLFLDEVAELPLDLQPRLLRVLQEQRFVPLGGTKPVSVDVRIVSATHRALRRAVEQHRFREDLMYRLRVVPLWLPRLAERDNDAELLLWHFVEEFNGRGRRQILRVTDEAMRMVLRYRWPGNIRELRNVLEYAYAIGEGEVLTPVDLTPEVRGEPPPTHWLDEPTAASQEREEILAALRESRGKKGEAARLLGMDRSTLWRKMQVLGL